MPTVPLEKSEGNFLSVPISQGLAYDDSFSAMVRFPRVEIVRRPTNLALTSIPEIVQYRFVASM
jgi:hypothetical protein